MKNIEIEFEQLPYNKDTRYAFACGKIKVKETKLLTLDILEKLIEAEDEKEVFNILKENNYIENTNSFDFEEIFHQKIKEVIFLLSKLTFDLPIINLFLLPYDLHNFKVLIKTKYKKETTEDLLEELGTLSLEKLKVETDKENFEIFPYPLSKELKKSFKYFKENLKPKFFEILVDKAYYIYFYKLASLSKISWLNTLAYIFIDLYNINSFIRLNFQEEKELIKETIIKKGALDFYIYNLSLDEFQGRLNFTPYKKLNSGIDYLKKHNLYFLLDKQIKEFILNFIKRAKHTMFGLEVLIGYFLACQNEIENLRIIFVGKKNKLSKSLIKERLRGTYV